MTHPDPATAYAALRDETAAMFGYDLADLSLTQGLQIDLVSLLRLEVDTMSGAVLAGETVDLARLVAAHGLLAKMLPSSALVAPAAAADQADQFAGAREELRALLSQRADALERREQRLEAEMAANPDAARRELEDKIQAAIQKYGEVSIPYPPGGGVDRHQSPLTNNEIFEDPAGGIAQHDGVVPHPAPVEPAATVSGGEPPLLIEPPPASLPPPKRVETDVERMNRVNSTPANPPREPSPWSAPRDTYSIQDNWSPKW